MLKKYKQDKEIWISMGKMYMKAGKWDAARDAMQRSLQSLPKQARKLKHPYINLLCELRVLIFLMW